MAPPLGAAYAITERTVPSSFHGPRPVIIHWYRTKQLAVSLVGGWGEFLQGSLKNIDKVELKICTSLLSEVALSVPGKAG